MDTGRGRILLASGGEDIKLWDLSSVTPVQQLSSHTEGISALSWSCNNQFLASASSSGDKVALNYVNSPSVIDLAAGNNQTCLAIMKSTSRYVASGGKSKLVTVWDLKTKKPKKQLKGHKDAVTCITFNWDDSHIASGSASGEVLIHNAASGQCGSPLSNPTGQMITSIEYSHFKKAYLAAVSDDGGLYLWDANTSRLLASFSNSHKAPATDLSFSPHNNLLLASCGLDKKIVCYDVVGKQVIKTLSADSPLTSLCFLHDGATLAAGSSHGKIFIFDLRAGEVPIKTLVGHKSSVQCLSFQNDVNAGKVKGSLPKTSSTPAQPATKGTSGRGSRTDPIHKQLPAQPQLTGGGGPPVSTKSGLQTDRVQPLAKKEPPTAGGGFNMSVFSPLNGDKSKENGGSYASGRLEAVGSETNNYSDSSLTAGGIFSPLRDGSSSITDSGPDAGLGAVEYSAWSHSAMQPIGVDTSRRRSRSTPVVNVNNNAPPLSVISPPMNNSENIPTRVPGSDSYRSKSHHREKDQSAEGSLTHQGAIHKRGMPTQPSSRGVSPQPEDTSEDTLAVNSGTTVRRGISRELPPRGLSPQPMSSSDDSSGTQHISAPPRTAPVGQQLCEPSQAPQSVPGAQAMKSIPVEFIRNMIEDAMEDFRDDIHRDMVNLHVELIRQFHIQQKEMQVLLERFSVNEGLLAEIERLKEENKRLKATF